MIWIQCVNVADGVRHGVQDTNTMHVAQIIFPPQTHILLGKNEVIAIVYAVDSI